MAAELGRTEGSLTFKALGALLLLCALGAIYATVRVILNELRWRRTGDPRGR
ncbi:MAG: hypothetical protein IPK85_04595 [Gemmatimonadetes bacterium]|nr:hypothetical protein [Gemmatimonadota bacterium]